MPDEACAVRVSVQQTRKCQTPKCVHASCSCQLVPVPFLSMHAREEAGRAEALTKACTGACTPLSSDDGIIKI